MFYAAVALSTAIPVVLGLLVVRAGQVRIGWLLVAQGVSVGLLLGGSRTTSTSTAGLVADQLLSGSWIFLFLWLVLIAYLLPDGYPLSDRWRRWVLTGLLGAVLFLVGAAGDRSGFRQEHGGRAPPLAWLPPLVSGLLGSIGLALVVALFFGSAVAIRSRLRGSAGEVRVQLLWLVWGSLAVPIGLLVVWANHFVLGDHGWLTDLTLTLVGVWLPVTIAIAILRHRLFDIQVVLSRTLTYGSLVVGVVALYALLLLVAERLGGNSSAGGLVAVAVVAVAVQPAYSWLRQRVERWVYGYRSEPNRALRLLADRADAAGPESLGAAVTEAVAEALHVDRVRVVTGDEDADACVVRTPLVHRGEQLGDLAVEVPPGRRLSTADLSLLRDLARYAAVLVRSERQGQQLRESRARIVAGREEERRRLRQDLHDGVGPSLAAIVLKLNAAQSRADGAERSALLAEARDEVRDAIAEVRRVVDDLRPPAIDEVGLLPAIRQRAAALSAGFTTEFAGPDPMPPLPAAVEVAVFRIASEAMANVARHAGATRCRIEVRVDDRLELTVADNGRGTDAATGRGVGWSSMQERAAELGGSCTIANRAEGGLLVRAVLPIGQHGAARADVEALA
ncbi:sensor histidine kinase [Nocardioides ungokensis]|uniref:sensor histidine kinase n=1 Tax=Nocardioides ungokensis TaxID=1643322 RepID=UPI0015DDA2AC|nr:sensor histidine kinase [Nocardioides ungokensis]